MRILSNAGSDTAAAFLDAHLAKGCRLDLATAQLGLFGFTALEPALSRVTSARLLLPAGANPAGLLPLGGRYDRSRRAVLGLHPIAQRAAAWLAAGTKVRHAPTALAGGLVLIRDAQGAPVAALQGNVSFTTTGLGLAPADAAGIVTAFDNAAEAATVAAWFEAQWATGTPEDAEALASGLEALVAPRPPRSLYALTLHHLLRNPDGSGALDEEGLLKAATGIRETAVWRMLYKFQRDGVVGVVDKLESHGGCILADSVGLGKTFEALAVLKYHELRNDRCLVLCPKRLRENWTLPLQNDRRNPLAADRFHYDVLHHTDLSRERGNSGDIDLQHLHWGNYDLVVIDESHNFRNKKSPKRGGLTRYDRLMKQIVREGVPTRVLMLSATPVNNRLADLKNQIAFATGGNDAALRDEGLPSIEATTRRAQTQFNAWLQLPAEEKTGPKLVDMLGFAYFHLLDLLTIARSRAHVERYYGTEETGEFPDRRTPINLKSDLDTHGSLPPVGRFHDDIGRLHLAAYRPLSYLQLSKVDAYAAKYDTGTGKGGGVWKQRDREESLTALMRSNLLKRLESSIHAFRLTLLRQLTDVDTLLARLEAFDPAEESPFSVEHLDDDDLSNDPLFESLTAGKSVRVLLADVDRLKWSHDLGQDRQRLAALVDLAGEVAPARDAKLTDLKALLEEKWAHPINEGNRKVLLFTAYADTAAYLHEQLADWAQERGIESGLITGGNAIRSTLGHVRGRQADLLAAFAPQAKLRSPEEADDPQLDLLIATDCISEGQNLQDCDFLVNYDIHWNPVRIIQRFGRIDRLGSPNAEIQLVNFWPNMEIDEYLNLETRVSGRMVLLDVSATGEENVIERSAGDPMNDLDYRRAQLQKLQTRVISLDDLSMGVSIADITLNDLRVDLADFDRTHRGRLEAEPFGVTSTAPAGDPDDAGDVFCLLDTTHSADAPRGTPDNPLAPLYLVHVAADGSVRTPHTRARPTLNLLRRDAQRATPPDEEELREAARFLPRSRKNLAAAIVSIRGQRSATRGAAIFEDDSAAPGTIAAPTDFEVLTHLVLL